MTHDEENGDVYSSYIGDIWLQMFENYGFYFTHK